uniref:Uncharacterized protein n=1 Tax=Candidatus Kentrum sp. MB TaxID=2138164 RepID=A0A451BEE5_9GAMM|nr:MAG: hypothetical protein BECKMB1821H_GA0114242_106616 [Candidatus Kentron sp. MB]
MTIPHVLPFEIVIQHFLLRVGRQVIIAMDYSLTDILKRGHLHQCVGGACIAQTQ